MTFFPPLFEMEDVSFRRANNSVLEHVHCSLLPGEYGAIIGPNGGGKTTLVRLLLGLEKPSSGAIRLFGTPQHRFHAWHEIGYVPQRAALMESTFPATVREVVAMGRYRLRGWCTRERLEDRNAITHAMEHMGINDLAHRLIGSLSGGQRQRVMIARALVSEPRLLIVDEPNTGVDVHAQGRFYTLLRTLNHEKKIAILFITHDIGVIAEDITRLFFVNQTLLHSALPTCEGVSRLYGTPAHLLHHDH